VGGVGECNRVRLEWSEAVSRQNNTCEAECLGEDTRLVCITWPCPWIGPAQQRSGWSSGQFRRGPGSGVLASARWEAYWHRLWIAVMHTSRVSSPRHSAARVFFCLETASLYSSPTRLHSATPPTHFPLCHRFLRHSTPLACTREGAGLPDDPRLASCSTRPLVCITDG
jgi:hypothetical protein